jgi:hypothetical protein
VAEHLSGWQRDVGDRWMPAGGLEPMGEYPTRGERLLGMFILFNTITIRDGIDTTKAHKAFLAIDEYRQAISPDTPGAERKTNADLR